MKYFIYGSSIFLKSNIFNMTELFNTFKIESNFVNAYIVQARNVDISKKIEPSVFYRILKIKNYGDIHKNSYLNDIKLVLDSTIIPNKRIRLECVDINSRNGFSAKDIEVFLGKNLEKKGVKISLENPELLFYIILFDMKCYIGYVSYKKIKFIDPGRHYKVLSSGISRAELKLIEAFDDFKINLKSNSIAIDLGASPGGWSIFLAKKNMNVIAIDQAELSLDKINSFNIKVIKQKDENINEIIKRKGSEEKQIIHIKKRFQDVDLGKIKKASILTCDMNIDPKDAATAVLLFSKYLKKDAYLIFTIKCKTRYVKKYIEETKDILSQKFVIKEIKALPSNRQELTLYARYATKFS
ncbi:MAG: SAM-dependent methyltransferase [Candidatus Micrarchaeia archaeon]